MSGWTQDVRYALRQLRKSLAATVVASYLPVLRAASIEPTQALRAE